MFYTRVSSIVITTTGVMGARLNDGPQEKRRLHKLLQAAKDYNSDNSTVRGFYEISFFYRNKPKEYFLEAERSDNILKKRMKDHNGDTKSPINGKIAGVFFSVTLFGGKFPDKSPFGDTRVHIPIEAVFRESTNLYFTDFYCTTSDNHYVTLVLTPRGFSEDVFCSKNLIKLDPVNNPFLKRPAQNIGNSYLSSQTRKYSTVRKSKFFVEVFYTENINLNMLFLEYGPDKVFFSETGIIGKGHSTWGGLRKNITCQLCNPASEPSGEKWYPYIHVSYGTMKPKVTVEPHIKRVGAERPRMTSETIIHEQMKIRKPATNYQPHSSYTGVEGNYVPSYATKTAHPEPRRNIKKAERSKGCCIIL